MKTNQLKYLVDTLLFVHVTSVAALGLLLGFVIPRGRARGVENTFLGLHRSDWADVHLYLSLAFLALLAVHIGFNRKWVAQSSQRYLGNFWKKWLWLVAGAWVVVLALAWIVNL